MSPLRTELELALRVTVDLAKSTTPQERDVLGRVLQISKDLHALRGTADPALAAIEEQLRALPLDSDPLSVATLAATYGVSLGKATELRAIITLLAERLSPDDIARRLGLHVRTVYRRITHYSLDRAVAALTNGASPPAP